MGAEHSRSGDTNGEWSGGGGIADGGDEGVLGRGMMGLEEGVNVEVQGRSKFGKCDVREIFSLEASEVGTLAGFGCQTQPKIRANLLQSFLTCPTRQQERHQSLDVQAVAKCPFSKQFRHV